MKIVYQKTGILLLSTETCEGHGQVEHRVAVHAHAIVGANVVRDFMARLSDFWGGRAGGYERALQSAVDQAAMEMARQAKSVGGNAVLGMRVQVSPVGRGMLLASCTGTAVRLSGLA